MISNKKDYHKGYLLKWTNYLRGYQKRWFVVSNGLLSYYRNQHEVSHACRGTINLATANIKVQDTLNIVLSNEGNQTFHLRTFSPEDTGQWFGALCSAKKTAIKLNNAVLEDDSDFEGGHRSTPACNISSMPVPFSSTNSFTDSTQNSPIIASSSTKDFDLKLFDLKHSVSLVKKNSDNLLVLLKQLGNTSPSWVASNYSINSELAGAYDLDNIKSVPNNHQDDRLSLSSTTSGNIVTSPASNASIKSHQPRPMSQSIHNDFRSPPGSVINNTIPDLVQKIKDKNKLFCVSAQACVNSCSEFVTQVQTLQTFYQKQLTIEREQRLRLENMVEELAKQLSALEKRAAKQLDNDVPVGVPHGKEYDDGNKTKQQEINTVDDSDDEHFFDAIEDEHMFNVSLPRAVSPQGSLMIEPKYMQNEYESCGSSDYESEQENMKSNSIARVIVRSSNKPRTSKKSINKKHRSEDCKTKSHRRTVSSGCTLQLQSPKISGQFGSFRKPQSCESNAKVELKTDNNPVADGDSEIFQSTSDELQTSTTNSSVSNRTLSELKSSKSVPSLLINEPLTINTIRNARRSRISPRPNVSVNLWGIMKNCIGKELSKIPVPVNFNEPLSMLQRLTEDLEYSECLDEAAACTDPIEQLARVAAFTVSSYSTTTSRTGKPFNPLLGETFECDRTQDEKGGGWRSIAEQVSHHPPAAALHAESVTAGWKCWQEFTMSSKFRGKYLAIIPLGIAHLTFSNSNNHYTWRKVTSTVHNIIVGRLWIDNHGEMDIYNHATGDTCHLNYKAYSYFSREPARKVTGVITDKNGVTKYVLNGTWDEYFEGAKVLEIRRDKNNQQIFETAPTKTLWKRNYPPAYTADMYNFTLFALSLNEPEADVAPTDSRVRPDQRLMEEGQWDEANKVKERLEEKQREKRRERERENEIRKRDGLEPIEHVPSWFSNSVDETTGQNIYHYNGEYWKTKAGAAWRSDLPDIF